MCHIVISVYCHQIYHDHQYLNIINSRFAISNVLPEWEDRKASFSRKCEDFLFWFVQWFKERALKLQRTRKCQWRFESNTFNT